MWFANSMSLNTSNSVRQSVTDCSTAVVSCVTHRYCRARGLCASSRASLRRVLRARTCQMMLSSSAGPCRRRAPAPVRRKAHVASVAPDRRLPDSRAFARPLYRVESAHHHLRFHLAERIDTANLSRRRRIKHGAAYRCSARMRRLSRSCVRQCRPSSIGAGQRRRRCAPNSR